jgi:hypothetical protein
MGAALLVELPRLSKVLYPVGRARCIRQRCNRHPIVLADRVGCGRPQSGSPVHLEGICAMIGNALPMAARRDCPNRISDIGLGKYSTVERRAHGGAYHSANPGFKAR